ncbi:MAG: hypothetical protein ABIY55_19185 [Kofleriaceae bacterium]
MPGIAAVWKSYKQAGFELFRHGGPSCATARYQGSMSLRREVLARFLPPKVLEQYWTIRAGRAKALEDARLAARTPPTGRTIAPRTPPAGGAIDPRTGRPPPHPDQGDQALALMMTVMGQYAAMVEAHPELAGVGLRRGLSARSAGGRGRAVHRRARGRLVRRPDEGGGAPLSIEPQRPGCGQTASQIEHATSATSNSVSGSASRSRIVRGAIGRFDLLVSSASAAGPAGGGSACAIGGTTTHGLGFGTATASAPDRAGQVFADALGVGRDHLRTGRIVRRALRSL